MTAAADLFAVPLPILQIAKKYRTKQSWYFQQLILFAMSLSIASKCDGIPHLNNSIVRAADLFAMPLSIISNCKKTPH